MAADKKASRPRKNGELDPSTDRMTSSFLGSAAALMILFSGCFRPDIACRLRCGDGEACPPGYQCVSAGRISVCKPLTLATCPAIEADGGDADASPPEICIRDCLKLRPSMSEALVLWLDPTNLPDPGLPLDRWIDRSGRTNDAIPMLSAPPISKGPDGISFDTGVLGAGLVVPDNDTLDFATHNFAIFVVAAVDISRFSCFFQKTNSALRPLTARVRMGWDRMGGGPPSFFTLSLNLLPTLTARASLPDQQVHLLVGVRHDNQMLIRINGEDVGRMAQMIPADESARNAGDAYLGVCNPDVEPIPDLKAIVILIGDKDFGDVQRIEKFLMSQWTVAP
jgi:hypothetical protein